MVLWTGKIPRVTQFTMQVITLSTADIADTWSTKDVKVRSNNFTVQWLSRKSREKWILLLGTFINLNLGLMI